MVCGVFYSTKSSNHCPVGQVVLQKSTLPHRKHGSVETESHTGLEAGVGGMWESVKEKNEIVVK